MVRSIAKHGPTTSTYAVVAEFYNVSSMARGEIISSSSVFLDDGSKWSIELTAGLAGTNGYLALRLCSDNDIKKIVNVALDLEIVRRGSGGSIKQNFSVAYKKFDLAPQSKSEYFALLTRIDNSAETLLYAHSCSDAVLKVAYKISPIETNEVESKHVGPTQEEDRQVRNSISSLVFDESTADVHIVLDSGERIPVHKFILMARSPVFKAMFTSDMRECNTNEIKITGFEVKIVREFLQFLYSNRCAEENEHMEWYQHLLILSHNYDIATLTALCEKKIIFLIESDNVLVLLSFAETYTQLQLKSKCIEFIAQHVEITQQDDFYTKISASHMKEIFMCMSHR